MVIQSPDFTIRANIFASIYAIIIVVNSNSQFGKFSLGATAAIITSMGLIAGLNFGIHAKAAIIGGLLVIALADNISDTFAIHIYKESETSDRAEIFTTTAGNFLVRLLITLSFVVLTLALPMSVLIYVESAWGLFLLALLSIHISNAKGTLAAKEIVLHLVLAILVVISSRCLGLLISHRLS